MKTNRDDHEGLAHDLKTMYALLERRRVMRLLAGASLVPLFGCGNDDASTLSDGAAGAGKCAVIPTETEGPYPGDGSNGSNALATSGVVRSDIRPSFGTLSGTAAGVPLTVQLSLVNTKASCAPLAGYAIYVWHCDREGNYSLYTITNQNYLRGVQETDASGLVKFTSIVPACYPGRWPHIHFEIFPSLAKAMGSGNKLKTSQLALPADVCSAAYKTDGYAQSVSALAQVSLARDNVFSDGSDLQVASVTGNTTDGYVADLTVGISA